MAFCSVKWVNTPQQSHQQAAITASSANGRAGKRDEYIVRRRDMTHTYWMGHTDRWLRQAVIHAIHRAQRLCWVRMVSSFVRSRHRHRTNTHSKHATHRLLSLWRVCGRWRTQFFFLFFFWLKPKFIQNKRIRANAKLQCGAAPRTIRWLNSTC